MGEKNYISTVAALLADAVYRQDRLEDAERYAAESAEVAAHDDVTSQALWRTVRAKVAARGGSVEEARRLATEAVELARTSEDPDLLTRALIAAAEVSGSTARAEEAWAALDEALEIVRAKGNVAAERQILAQRESNKRVPS